MLKETSCDSNLFLEMGKYTVQVTRRNDEILGAGRVVDEIKKHRCTSTGIRVKLNEFDVRLETS